MQAVSQKLARAKPFTSAKYVAARPTVVSGVRVALPTRIDLSVRATADIDAQYANQIDVPLTSSSAPAALPAAGENVRLRIRMRSYEVNLLTDAITQIRAVAEATGAAFKGPVMLPTKKKLYCVLRSPHVNKDSREHFEIRIHNRLVDLKNLSAETVQSLMSWSPPAGVEVECNYVL